MITDGLINYPTAGHVWQKARSLLHCMWIVGAMYELNQSMSRDLSWY